MRNLLLVASSAILLAPAFASANLLTNGGFDLYTGPAFSGYQALGVGDTSITGWTANTRMNDVTIDIVDSSYGYVSSPYAVDLAGTPGPGSISQTLTGLASGLYTVSFYARTTDGNPVIASFGGTTQTFNLTGTYKLYSFTAMASGTSMLTLATNDSSNGNVFVDNANVSAVPSPAAMASFGVAALAGLRRRAKRA